MDDFRQLTGLDQAQQQLALINGHPRNHNNKEQS